jgi:hypothetical protein
VVWKPSRWSLLGMDQSTDLPPADEGDLAEQRTPADRTDPVISPVEVPEGADEADALDQQRAVPEEDDDRDR